LPALVLELLDRVAFILQVQGVFTSIRSGANPVADDGDALGIFSRAAVVLAGRRRSSNRTDLFERPLPRRMENPMGLGAYL
jgi:hypothetical protein